MKISSRNPVSGELVFEGEIATEAEVDGKVQGSRLAFAMWGRTSLEDRIAVLQRYAGLLGEARESMATLIGRETGKPLWDARTEVAAMIGKVAISIEAYRKRTGGSTEEGAGQHVVLRHRPHGVMAVLGPFNFPGHLPNGHIVPALLAGNTVVFKPSEFAPSVALAMAGLWQEAGLPAGVLQVVIGDGATGAALAKHPGIDGLCFTGSSRTGGKLHEAFASQPQKILALEMGGNNPLVVEEGIDVPGALHHILMSAFVTAGQRCTCARRLIVPEGAWGDGLLAKLATATKALKVGSWDEDPQPFLGAVISLAAAERVIEAQEDLLAKGGRAIVEAELLRSGTALVSPGLVDVSAVKDLPDEEVFGPLLQVQRSRSFEHALELANATRYGLAAGLLSPDAWHWQTFVQAVRAGVVNWNRPLTGASSALPFGGVGASGNHRPSAAYAADYCAYPVASLETTEVIVPESLPPGMTL